MRATSLCLTLAVKSAFAATLYSNSFGVPGLNATYDYVVIGGGTAGLTIAARLAEDPNVSVAVIEAGGFYQQENGNGRSVTSTAWYKKLPIDHASASFPVYAQRNSQAPIQTTPNLS
jgi:choline dehydrogenase-like flavoprotein